MKKKLIGGRYIPNNDNKYKLMINPNLFNNEEDSEEEEEDDENENEEFQNRRVDIILELDVIYEYLTKNVELIYRPLFDNFMLGYQYLNLLQPFEYDIERKYREIIRINNARSENIDQYHSDRFNILRFINNGIIPALSQDEIKSLIDRAKRYQLNNKYIEPLNDLLVAKYMVDDLQGTKQGTKRKRTDSMSTKKKRDIDEIDKLIKECERLLKLT